jgi:hypothetical protein
MLLSPSDCSPETQPTKEVAASSKKEHSGLPVLSYTDRGKITESDAVPQCNSKPAFLYVYLNRKLQLAISSGQNYPLVYSKPSPNRVAEA